jgi:hypothetical protein
VWRYSKNERNNNNVSTAIEFFLKHKSKGEGSLTMGYLDNESLKKYEKILKIEKKLFMFFYF